MTNRKIATLFTLCVFSSIFLCKQIKTEYEECNNIETNETRSNSVLHLQSIDQFDQLIAQGNVIIDFYATWCPPCKKLSPIIDKLAKEYSNVRFIKINIDNFRPLANRFNIRSIPTLLFFKDGKNVHRNGSLTEKALKEKIEKIF